MMSSFQISLAEYQQKRYEIARDILSSIITAEKINQMTERKQRESMVYGCIQLSEVLLEGLGLFGKDVSADQSDGSKMTSISDLMKSLKKSESEDS